MESIKLTEEHKSKLLEMCKALFPEYLEILWDSTNTDNPIFTDDDEDLKYKCRWSIDNNLIHFLEKESWDDEENYLIEIHWFEFCMTHLADKILKNNYFKIGAFSSIVLFKKNHPVDYLYEKFSKLKKQPEKTVHKETLDISKYKIARK